MKTKLIAFCMAGVLFGSCSADDDKELTAAGCEYEVTGLSSDCSNSVCDYEVTYKNASGEETTVVINQSTYDYYKGVVGNGGQSDCWQGKK